MKKKQENSNVAEWLRTEREKRGWSRTHVAKIAGRSVKTIQQVELGYQELGEASRMKLEQAFGETSQVGEEPGLYNVNEKHVNEVIDAAYDILTDPEKRAALKLLTIEGQSEKEILKLLISKRLRK